MLPTLPDTLAQLSKDHTAFRRVLNVLERQIENVAQYRTPDFDILNGVLSYFQEYPGRFHHPVEHLIYGSLQNRVPEVADGIAAIEEQHSQIAGELKAFGKAVQDVLGNAEISRRAFCHAARAFITFERMHIRGEENSLFYMALSRLLPSDWLLIDSAARRVWAQSSKPRDTEYFNKIVVDLTTWDFENTHK